MQSSSADILVHQLELLSSIKGDDDKDMFKPPNSLPLDLVQEAQNPWGEGTTYTYDRDCALWLNVAGGEYKVEGKSVVVHEEEHVGNEDTGLTVWDGAVVLGKFLEYNITRSILEQLEVLELGSGSGLCGITASVLGAKNVLLTDLEYCQTNLQKSIATNQAICEGNIQATVLDWFQPINVDEMSHRLHRPIMIIAADVVWLENLVVPLCSTLENLLHRFGHRNMENRTCACTVGKTSIIGKSHEQMSDSGMQVEEDTVDDLGLTSEFTRSGKTSVSKTYSGESEWLQDKTRGTVAYISYTFRFDEVHSLLMKEFNSRFCWSEIPPEQIPWVGSDCHFDESPQVHIYRIQLRCSKPE